MDSSRNLPIWIAPMSATKESSLVFSNAAVASTCASKSGRFIRPTSIF
jgi:hypothetical protein